MPSLAPSSQKTIQKKGPVQDATSSTLHATKDVYDALGDGATVAKHPAGYMAFYRYHVWERELETGKRGLAGLVRSKDARIAFTHIEEFGKTVDKHLLFLCFATTIADRWDRLAKISESPGDIDTKARKLSAEVIGITWKSLIEFCPLNPHMLYKVSDLTMKAGEYVAPARTAQLRGWEKWVEEHDLRWQAAVDHYTDGETIYINVTARSVSGKRK